jgi:acetyl esterase/lipase
MKTYRLWTADAPGALGTADADIPTLTDYGTDSQPVGTARSACIVCPGGAYHGLAPHEGQPVAEWYERLGIRGFVLKYRLGPAYHHPTMLHDAERAIRYVRANASQLGVDASRVGITGFSAGGHLASTVSTHNSPGSTSSSDPIERQSSKPNWAVLIYPVIDMKDPYAHAYSREMLLGKTPNPKDVADLSNYNAVSLETPPTFLCHGANDEVVPIQNSLKYAMALSDHKIPFEAYFPQIGPHGFGLGKPGSDQDWTGLCEKWLRLRGLA